MHARRRAVRHDSDTSRVPFAPEAGRRNRPARRPPLPESPADVAFALQARIGNTEVLLRIRAEQEGSRTSEFGLRVHKPNPQDRVPGRRDPDGRSRPNPPKARVRAGEDAGGIEGTWVPGPSAEVQQAPSTPPAGGARGRGRPSTASPPVGPGAASDRGAGAATTTLALSPEGGAPMDLVQAAGEAFQAGLVRCQEREAACREAHEDAGRRFGGGFFGASPSVGAILREDAQREMLVHAHVGRSEDILGTTLVATLQTAAQAWDVRDEVLGRLAASGLADIGEDGQVRVASGAMAAQAIQARQQLGPATFGLEARGAALNPAPVVEADIAEVQATRAALGAVLDRARARAVDASVDADREERARIAAFIDLCDDVEKTSILVAGLSAGPKAGLAGVEAASEAGSMAAGNLGMRADSATGYAVETLHRPRLDELQARIGAAMALSGTLRMVATEGDLAGRHAAFEAAVLHWSAGLSSARAQADRQVAELANLGLVVDLAAGRSGGEQGGLGQTLADLASAGEAAGFAAAVAQPLASIADRLSTFHEDATQQSTVPAGAVSLGPLRRALAEEGDLAQVWAREARRLAGEANGTRTALDAASGLFQAPRQDG